MFAHKGNNIHLTWNRTCNSEKAGSKAIVSINERIIALKKDDTNINFWRRQASPHLTIKTPNEGHLQKNLY